MPMNAQEMDEFLLDRVDRMITWLRENRDKIAESEKGKITFNYSGLRITARREDVQEKI